jgi:hypothetical protein
MNRDRIRVDVPASDARRERVEHDVFERLAAIRASDRAEAIAPGRQRPRFVMAFAAVGAVAAVLIAVLLIGRERGPAEPGAPSLVETPVGGSSRFTVGDAVIVAGGDTSVGVSTTEDGVVLVLGRGTIDCDVTPREGRRPFRVLAGDVEVVVVGTRFAVTRAGPGARVDVMRGKVRVRSAAGERMLTAGESWTSTAITPGTTSTESPAPPVVAPEPAVDTPSAEPSIEAPVVTDPAPTRPRPTSREAFTAAQLLESKDLRKAARAYRAIANGKDVWAALALYSLAELQAASDPDESLRHLDELTRRFPNGANAEDAAWLRVDVLRRASRPDEARAAAEAYLRAFPRGTYAKPAARLAAPQ